MSSKDTYWFPHDSNARHDPKIITLISEYGAKGYGFYWIMVEMLREQTDYSLDISKPYVISAIAHQFGRDINDDQVNDFIKFGASIDLFNIDNGILICNTLNNRLKRFDEIKEKRKIAANKRWNKNVETEEQVEILHEELSFEPAPKEKKKNYKFEMKHEFFDNLEFSEYWYNWIEARRKKKSPPTEIAKRDAFNKLLKLSNNDINKAIQIVKYASNNSWLDFYELKENNYHAKSEPTIDKIIVS